MELRKVNNKIVKITDISNQFFQGVVLYEDKDAFAEEDDALSVKIGSRWTRLFENEILKVEIIDKINQPKSP